MITYICLILKIENNIKNIKIIDYIVQPSSLQTLYKLSYKSVTTGFLSRHTVGCTFSLPNRKFDDTSNSLVSLTTMFVVLFVMFV